MSDNIAKSALSIGLEVVINPRDDRTRKRLVRGQIDEILTNVEQHPHGILVKLTDGTVGRVKSIGSHKH